MDYTSFQSTNFILNMSCGAEERGLTRGVFRGGGVMHDPDICFYNPPNSSHFTWCNLYISVIWTEVDFQVTP